MDELQSRRRGTNRGRAPRARLSLSAEPTRCRRIRRCVVCLELEHPGHRRVGGCREAGNRDQVSPRTAGAPAGAPSLRVTDSLRAALREAPASDGGSHTSTPETGSLGGPRARHRWRSQDSGVWAAVSPGPARPGCREVPRKNVRRRVPRRYSPCGVVGGACRSLSSKLGAAAEEKFRASGCARILAAGRALDHPRPSLAATGRLPPAGPRHG